MMNVQNKIFLCVLSCLAVLACPAWADNLCGKWDTLNVLGGEYRINNNVWGSNPGEQCITAYSNSTYFSVNHSTHDSGNVEAYPFILKGCHWGSCTTDSGFPIRVSDVVTAPFVWSVDTNNAGGAWNVAYESWFSTSGGTAPDAAELMIWIDHNGGVGPGGSYIKTISIGGFNWEVYHASPWSSWDHYIAYKITTPTNYVSLDLKDFIDDSVSEGWIDTAWYLDNMEAGFELWRDGEGLTSNSFLCVVNGIFSTDFTNFADFASEWLRTDCDGANNWCNGADYPPEDRTVDLEDLQMFVADWLAE